MGWGGGRQHNAVGGGDSIMRWGGRQLIAVGGGGRQHNAMGKGGTTA